MRKIQLAVPYQWGLNPAFALWLDVHAELNAVTCAGLDTLDYRYKLLPTIVHYNLYSGGSLTPQVHATTKRQGGYQKAGWLFVIATQITPRAEDEVIVGIAVGPLIPQEIDQHVNNLLARQSLWVDFLNKLF